MPKLIGCSQDMGESKTAQIKMGLRHFLFFLNSNIQLQETWWPILGKGPITDPDSIPREFFTTSNIDKFGHYMADYARHYVGDVQSGNKNISVQTAENYFGAVNTYYSAHHSTYKDLPVMAPFELSKWKSLRQQMIKKATARVHAANGSVSIPRETISDDDYKIIAFICWFYQSLLMQSFLFFTCLLIQIGGRGTESASRLFKNLTVVPFKNNQRSSSVLQIAVVRSKTQHEQLLKIYPQAKVDFWYKDFYFLLATNLMTRSNEETGSFIDQQSPIFPSFFETHIQDEANKNSRSLVSKLFRTFYDKIVDVYSAGVDIIFNVDGQLNKNLSSHGGKKAFMQTMSDMGNNPVATVFRAGLTLKKMHTMFDYVFGSTAMDTETGLNISGWSNHTGSGPKNGGLSPLIEDALNAGSDEQCKNELNQIKSFCQLLFFRSKLGDQFHQLLLASVFKHWEAMVCTCNVNLHLKTHSVIIFVNQVLSSCNISRETFDGWCKNTVLAFKLKNISALDYEEIKDLPEGATVDVRNFIDQQERLSNMVNVANIQLVTAVGTVAQIRDSQMQEQTQRNRMEAQQNRIEAKLDTILSFNHLQVPETHPTTHLPKAEPISNPTSIQPTNDIHVPQLSFRHWIETKAKSQNNKICPIRSFLHHEQFNLAAGHKLDKSTDMKNKIDPLMRRKNNSAYYKHSIAVQVMHSMLKKHDVPEFPHESLDLIPEWQQRIRQQLEPLLYDLREKNDPIKSSKRSKRMLPTINQLNVWSSQFPLIPEEALNPNETPIDC